MGLEAQDKDIRQFLWVGKMEGYSYLLLLFVAMPLKYFADLPQAVRIMGSIHGFLFVAFIYTIVVLFSKSRMGLGGSVLALVLSLVPFGTFFLERCLKKEDKASQ